MPQQTHHGSAAIAESSQPPASRVIRAFVHWFAIPCAAITMTLWPTLSSGLAKLQYDPGDSLLNLYFLEHAFQHFTSTEFFHPESFWSPGFFWPVRDVLTWSDHLLAPSVIYGIFRIALNPYASFSGWLVATLWLNYTAIRMCLMRISPLTHPVLVSSTALATTFSPIFIEQLGHPQLLSIYMLGPILWQCHRLIQHEVESFSISDWLFLGACLLCNGFFNIYIFVYSCYGALVCTAIHIGRRVKKHALKIRIGEKLKLGLAFFSSCALINAIIYVPYLRALKTFGARPSEEILNNLPKPASWMFGNSELLIPPPITDKIAESTWLYGAEQKLFPGWAICILLAAAILTSSRIRDKIDNGLRIWLVVAGLMVIGSINIDHLSAWPLISKLIPGASSLRASSRIGMIIILFAAPAISLAGSYWRLFEDKTYRSASFGALLLGSFIGIGVRDLPAFSLATWKQELDQISAAITRNSCDLFWYEWKDQPPFRAQVLAMHAEQRTSIPTLNGYSGQFPKEGWPFAWSSGDLAYDWVRKSNPGQYHAIKTGINPKRQCIVFLDADHRGRARVFDPRKPRPVITINTPDSIVFSNSLAEVGFKNNELYFRTSAAAKAGPWIMIYRDGKSVPADRGNYAISSARITGSKLRPVLEITDRDSISGNQYVWSINAQTGQFLGQVEISP